MKEHIIVTAEVNENIYKSEIQQIIKGGRG